MNSTREKGKVHFCDNFKGYGFIRRAEGKDAFFVYSEVEGYDGLTELYAGDSVEFEIVKTDKGPRALAIKLG
ncbi:cold shock domain-containing protein [Pseudomonas monachiensis]|uniref:Cold shock domain-containing protein n=1 Tax=Pseudomonas monachiensis TaxID=3060212 RepID=A0ABW9HCH9_9PSED